MSDIVNDILGCTDEILGLRDELGATKHKVYILTRTWTGSEPGDGAAQDSITQVLPTPYLVDYSHSLRLREGGKIREGDILLKHLSKETYTEESMIDCSVESRNVEKYYYINGRLYTVISITSHYVYWNVLVRKASRQKVYL